LPNASFEEIKESYKRRVLQQHPDKQNTKQDGTLSNSKVFQDLQQAWEILRDSTSREKYDKERQILIKKEELPVDGELDLDDMIFNELTETYSYGCRCGDKFLVNLQQLEDGVEHINCSSCSLTKRLLYEEVVD